MHEAKEATKRSSLLCGLRKGIVFFAMLCCILAGVTPAFAISDAPPQRMVAPLGHTVGIRLFSEGLLVVDLSEKEGQTPAEAAGLQTGDLLLAMNRQELKSTEQLQEALQENGARPVSLTVKRGAKTLSMTATPESGADGVYRLGAWVRDSMAGIGTMTYYDPQSGKFGALGHGITDVDTGQLMPVASGSLMPSTVAAVKKGAAGVPGELTGDFRPDVTLGELTCNCSSGVFGTLSCPEAFRGALMPVARRGEVRCGKAVIRANIEGNRVEEFNIKITKLMDHGADGKDMMIRVTDDRLLSRTGGIVQGMSGSPILQDGKLVGAVTHVLVNSPDKGYGIFIENMLAAAE